MKSKIKEYELIDIEDLLTEKQEKITWPNSWDETLIYKKQRLNSDPHGYSFWTRLHEVNNMATCLRNLGILISIIATGLIPQCPIYINIICGAIILLISLFSYILRINAIEEFDKNFFDYLSLIMRWILLIYSINLGLSYFINQLTFISYIISVATLIVGLVYAIVGHRLLKM